MLALIVCSQGKAEIRINAPKGSNDEGREPYILNYVPGDMVYDVYMLLRVVKPTSQMKEQT